MSVTDKIVQIYNANNELIDLANDITGNGDVTITGAVNSLINACIDNSTNFEVISQSLFDIDRRIDEKPAEIQVGNVDSLELSRERQPRILYAEGTPNSSLRPDNFPEGLRWTGIPGFIGQIYINTAASSSGLYYANGTTSTSNWKQA